MEKELYFIKMVQNMKEIGKIIKSMEKEYLNLIMEMYMKVNS